MATDRELLELAARAVGIVGTWASVHQAYGDQTVEGLYCGSPIFWNPLADDGDALRLAIDANVRFDLVLEDSRGYAEAESVYIEFEWDMHRPSDRYEAVRRAIVRVAAESVATKEA